MARPSYKLESAETIHRESPISFSIPRRVVRENFQVGDFVKLLFLNPSGRQERMWVEVSEVANGSYVGLLRNDPAIIKRLKYDDSVSFSAEHVSAYYNPAPNPNAARPEQLARVERSVWEKKKLPKHLFRKRPTKHQSGWFLFNSKPPEKLPGEIDFIDVPICLLCEDFRILDSVLDQSTGNPWKWHTKNLEYVEVIHSKKK